MWTGENKAELIRQISFEEPVRLQKINPAIPHDLETIALKAIEKHPGDRYGNMQELTEDLVRFLERKPILARRTTVTGHVTKWALRHRAVVASALSACLLVTVTCCVATLIIWNESLRRTSAESEKQVAIEEADNANKRMGVINDFVIKKIVDSAKPTFQNGDHNITVHDSLLAANQLVDESFNDDSVLRSHVKTSFGEYFYTIGEYKLARENLEAALQVYSQVYGDENSHSIDAMCQLTKVYREDGELDLALATAQKVLSLTDKLYGKQDQDFVNSLFLLGTIYSRQKKLVEAEQTLTQVIELSRAGEFPLLEASAINELGNVSFYQQRYSKAESYWSSALKLYQQRNSGFNAILAKVNLARVYWETERKDQSIALSEQAINEMSALSGPTHPITLKAINDLAVKRSETRDYAGAAESFRLLYSRTESKFGPRHKNTVNAMTDLGAALLHVGQFDESLKLQLAALDIVKEDAEKSTHIFGNIASTYERIGDFERAADNFQRAIEGQLQMLQEHPENVTIAVGLAGEYCNFGNFLRDKRRDFDKANECFTEAIGILEKLNASSPTVRGKTFLVNSYYRRAQTSGDLEQWDNAIADVDKAILNSAPDRKDDMRLRKARLLATSGDLVESASILDDVLSRIAQDDGNKFYIAANIMALCAGKVKQPANFDESSPQLDFDEYAKRCLQFLAQANESGYFKYPYLVEELNDDSAFEPVRDLAEFKQFTEKIALENTNDMEKPQ